MPTLNGVLSVAGKDRAIAGAVKNIGEETLHVTAPDEVHPWLVGALSAHVPLLVVTASGREAEDLTAELAAMVGDKVMYFPSWETLPHERLSPGVDIIGAQAKVLHHLDSLDVVVTAARGLSQPFVSEVTGREPVRLTVGEDSPFEELIDALVFRSYTRVDLVAARGEFAVRGGIIDIFPTTANNPVRVEFWGDEITEITTFAVADQRTYSDGGLDAVELYPARALPITEEIKNRAAELAHAYGGNQALAQILGKAAEGIAADGMETLIPVLTDSPLVTLVDKLPENAHVLLVDPERIRTRVGDLKATDTEFLEAGWELAAMGGTGPVDHKDLDLEPSSYRSLESIEVSAKKAGHPVWTLTPPGIMTGDDADTLPLTFAEPVRPRGDEKKISQLMSQLLAHTLAGGAAVYVSPQKANCARFADKLHERGIANIRGTDSMCPKAGAVTIYQAFSHNGVVFNPAGSDTPLVVVTETDVTGNRVGDIAGAKRRKAKKRNRVDPLALTAGDYVVHETHGIGRFVKMTEREVRTGDDTSRREYIVLEYAPSRRGGPPDQLYVPMDSLDLLSKYVGGEKPAVSKMGGADWKRTKKKARGAVKEIAAELVDLYAKRRATPGHAFAPDSPWQTEMEDNFPYVETEDQMLAIDAVKHDMEQPVPMDRVIIGDVGYGKTEVAVRAAFKAVQDGKQVAVLVPTTLLAQQHEATFRERMDGFGVTIRQLSRFTPEKESREILQGLVDGSVDIVIGTHRLLQTGVQWKDLGLVIVDEEQRFGVEHKEHIKALRAHVDVLTMSATPIPRTLEMSMSGIREMTTILTPPQDRRPVLTYVGAQEDKQVAAAIRRELLRDGQVFCVHNRVKSIEERARQLRELVPEARIVVAHGQMSEEQLEKTVQGFWGREFDVLVCTTIVETGLDIANANTLIVENAHHMGLSQLHQLRGRVGRSRERAYAYFLYPKGQILTETSYERLTTIAQNNDMGAGMAVAMKDLEMRGAGNVLGAEQSGHIAGVGFDLYVRLVEEAVEAFRALADGKPLDATDQQPAEIRVDLPVDSHIPDDYIASERLRLEIYRKLAASRTEDDLSHVVEEMSDRYGPIPEPVLRLLSVTRLRHLARRAGIVDISLQGTRVKLHPVELPDSKQVRLKRVYPGSSYRPAAKAVQVKVPKSGVGRVNDKELRDTELVQWVADVIASLCDQDVVDVTGSQGDKQQKKKKVISVGGGSKRNS